MCGNQLIDFVVLLISQCEMTEGETNAIVIQSNANLLA